MKIEKRCPWCGEVYIKSRENHLLGSPHLLYCKKCKHTGERKIPIRALIVIITAIIAKRFLDEFGIESRILISTIYWVIFLVGVYLSLNSSYYRYTRLEEGKPPREKSLCEAAIHWYSAKKSGLYFPRIRIISGMTFPVCFVDDNDIPVSQVGVVRFVKRYGLFWKGAELLLITDFIKEDEVKEGQKFYIFNARERIGEGVVTYKRW